MYNIGLVSITFCNAGTLSGVHLFDHLLRPIFHLQLQIIDFLQVLTDSWNIRLKHTKVQWG